MFDGAISVDERVESPSWSAAKRSVTGETAVATLSAVPQQEAEIESTPVCVFTGSHTGLPGVLTRNPTNRNRNTRPRPTSGQVSEPLRRAGFGIQSPAPLCWPG